jgi:hypothetical protein
MKIATAAGRKIEKTTIEARVPQERSPGRISKTLLIWKECYYKDK